MEILLADAAGFCMGVRRAVSKAEAAVRAGGPVCSLGPLIHNPQEVARLAGEGVAVAERPEDARGTVVIRAHGAPPAVYAALERQGVRVVDATCPFVTALQRKAAALAAEGHVPVIVGDPDHPEVAGVVGWTGGRALVVSGPEEVDALPPLERVGVLAQTTQREERVREVVARLRAKAREVRVEDTICRATAERQEAARRLAGQVQVMVVVGGATSSNTQKLVSVCRDAGAVTYHVETADDLRPEWFAGVSRVGLTAGASTPDWIIKEVVGRMEEIAREGDGQAAVAEGQDVPQTQGDVGMKTPRRGQVIEGTVVRVTPDQLLVDVGYKSDGVVTRAEMGLWPGESPEDVFQEGQRIRVWVLGVDEQEGELRLSRRRARDRDAWRTLEKALAEGSTIEGTVREVVKGGLVVDVGTRAFLPASQVDLGYVPDLSGYVGQRVRVRILELDRGGRKLVVSRRKVLEEERERQRADVLAGLEEGQVRTGRVKSLTDFGAFVDLGGIDGLVHVSELSWQRVGHPSQVVSPGDEVTVKVLRVDREQGRVSLSIKQAQPDPWQDVAVRYPEGSWVTGRVVRIVPFGAFIELEPGVEGLAHISQLAPRRVSDPREVVQEGDDVQVRILRTVPAEKRISLSLVPEARRPARDGQRQRPERRERAHRQASEMGEHVTLGEMYGDLFEETKARLNGQ